MPDTLRWTLLVYRIPAHPTRLRLAVWRKLQKMGALALQDAICVVPDRPDLTENLHYVAQSITEMGGSCQLFAAASLLPGGAEEIVAGFRALADQRLSEIVERSAAIEHSLAEAGGTRAVERIEEDLKRERIAYLRARKLAYCGATPEREAEVDTALERLRSALDTLFRHESK